jgi:hypothetical protein
MPYGSSVPDRMQGIGVTACHPENREEAAKNSVSEDRSHVSTAVWSGMRALIYRVQVRGGEDGGRASTKACEPPDACSRDPGVQRAAPRPRIPASGWCTQAVRL